MILLSFDIEEFDMPLEYGKDIAFSDQISISQKGCSIILGLLKKHQIKATFFCTATYALNDPQTIRKMIAEGHEVASHGYFHSDFKPEHLYSSKKILEEISSSEVIGFRMARMMPVDEGEVARAGYVYNTSLNPTWLPGRYNNFLKRRTHFMNEGVIQIPASVTPAIRFPLFWLSFHNLPENVYRLFCKWAYRKDGYLNLYFHPWEFTDLDDKARFNFPGYVSRNSGDKMAEKMDKLIVWMKEQNFEFGTFKEFIAKIKEEGRRKR